MNLRSLLALLLVCSCMGTAFANTTMTETEARTFLAKSLAVWKMSGENVHSTSYTVEYTIKDVNSPGFLTENPFWYPESVGDHEIKTIVTDGDISVISTTEGLFIDKIPLSSVGIKEDGSTKSILYDKPREVRIWRSPEGKVYENSMPRSWYKVYTDTRITTDSFILDKALYSFVLIPPIMTKTKGDEAVYFRNARCDDISSTAAIVSYDMNQVAFGKPLRAVSVISLQDFTSPMYYVVRPGDSSGGRTPITMTHDTYARKDGIIYLDSENYALPLDPPFTDSLMKWHMKYPPEFNGDYEIPAFTTAPVVMDETMPSG